MKSNSHERQERRGCLFHSIPFPSNTAAVKARAYETEEEVKFSS